MSMNAILTLRARIALLVGAVSLGLPGAAPASARKPASAEPVAVRAAWIGGPTLLIRFGPIVIVTDPVLGEGPEAFRIFDPNSGLADAVQARLVPLPDLPLAGADLVLLSHDHEDHLDATAVSRLGARAPFLVPEAQAAKVRARGVARVAGLGRDGSRTSAERGFTVTITAVPARHSERSDLLPLLGEVNAYWLEFRRGQYRRTLYWTGDGFPPAEGLPKRFRAPDLFVPHLGGVGAAGALGPVSMGAEHAVRFARIVRPRAILPIHHSTFSLYREPIALFVRAAEEAGFRVARLAEGEELVLP